MPREFRLTEDHLKLVRAMYVGWQDCETGAPEIDPKRPYGNSFVAGDVIEILGWADVENDDDPQRDKALELHRETETVVAIILARAGEPTLPGLYRNEARRPWLRPLWKRIGE